MTKNIDTILAYLSELFPNAQCELEYTKDYELLIAIILSAQCTDKRVNIVTKRLFADYPSLESLNEASLKDIEEHIKELGLYKNKAKSIKNTTKILIENYDGVVPKDKKLLIQLPGVGNKTANVFRAEWYHEPEIAVDTHVARVAKRLGLANEKDDVTVVEKKLRKYLNEDYYIKAHHQLIHFGRYFCKAISPHCKDCKLKHICKSYNSKFASKTV